MNIFRLIAFLLSGTSAAMIFFGVMDGRFDAPEGWQNSVFFMWLWLGWVIPAAVLFIDKVRS